MAPVVEVSDPVAPVILERLREAGVCRLLLACGERSQVEPIGRRRSLRLALERDLHLPEDPHLPIPAAGEQLGDHRFVRQRALVDHDSGSSWREIHEPLRAPLRLVDHRAADAAAMVVDRGQADRRHPRERRMAADEHVAGEGAVGGGDHDDVVLHVDRRCAPEALDPRHADKLHANQRDRLGVGHVGDRGAPRPGREGGSSIRRAAGTWRRGYIRPARGVSNLVRAAQGRGQNCLLGSRASLIDQEVRYEIQAPHSAARWCWRWLRHRRQWRRRSRSPGRRSPRPMRRLATVCSSTPATRSATCTTSEQRRPAAPEPTPTLGPRALWRSVLRAAGCTQSMPAATRSASSASSVPTCGARQSCRPAARSRSASQWDRAPSTC